MKLSDLCKERRIDTTKTRTPLLVPSFSSRGFPKIRKIQSVAAEFVSAVSLVSAYDLHHGYLDEHDIYCSETLFLDSGGFEAGTSQDLTDFYGSAGQPKEWSEDQFLKTVLSLTPLSAMVVISYDTRAPMAEQIASAQSLFAKIPTQYAKDLLIKPVTKDSGLVVIKSVVDFCDQFDDFDIIGVTEKELGSSLRERCRNIVKIRKALYDSGTEKPIHILGCLDPLSVLVYFLCGADIFDGLSWLRLAYDEGMAMYYNSYVLTHGLWTQPYGSVQVGACIENLQQLGRTQANMERFARNYDWTVLDLQPNHEKQIRSLIGSAGVDF